MNGLQPLVVVALSLAGGSLAGCDRYQSEIVHWDGPTPAGDRIVVEDAPSTRHRLRSNGARIFESDEVRVVVHLSPWEVGGPCRIDSLDLYTVPVEEDEAHDVWGMWSPARCRDWFWGCTVEDTDSGIRLRHEPGWSPEPYELPPDYTTGNPPQLCGAADTSFDLRVEY